MSAGTLTYFMPVQRSRGEPTQLCIAYGGVDMKVELISFEEWGKRKAAGVAPFLPYITQPDGTIMLETTVIMKHIGTLGGKFVVDAKQDALCEMSNDPPMQQCDPTTTSGGGGRDKAGQPEYDAWFAAAGDGLKDYVAKLGDGPSLRAPSRATPSASSGTISITSSASTSPPSPRTSARLPWRS